MSSSPSIISVGVLTCGMTSIRILDSAFSFHIETRSSKKMFRDLRNAPGSRTVT